MKTLSFAIEDDIYAQAEEKATALNTSVPSVVERYLRMWAMTPDVDEARQAMVSKFANPDWSFAVGEPDDRTQRNARR
jgi:hypothetical protein